MTETLVTEEGQVTPATSYARITVMIGDGSTVVTTGVKGFIIVPYACTIIGWNIISDVSGSIVVDVWRDTLANSPPTVADTIAGTEKPALSSADEASDDDLSTWTPTLAEGDVLAFNVDSAATVKAVCLSLRVQRT